MYAKYVWNTSATQAQMLSDICKLICGSAVADLSDSCDKSASAVLANTAQNNWELFDDAASTSSKVIRSLCEDGVWYKYLSLTFSGSILTAKLYESWNASTHVGTNQGFFQTNVLATPTVHDAFTASAGGILYINATSRYVALSVAAVGTGTGLRALVGEFKRESKAIDNTYPCSFLQCFNPLIGTYDGGVSGALSAVSSLAAQAALCRVKYAASAGDLKYGSTPAYAYPVSHLGDPLRISTITATQVLPIRIAGSERQVYPASPMHIYTCGGTGGKNLFLGTVRDLLGVALTANHLDEIDIEGTRYVLLSKRVGNTGSGQILIPRG